MSQRIIWHTGKATKPENPDNNNPDFVMEREESKRKRLKLSPLKPTAAPLVFRFLFVFCTVYDKRYQGIYQYKETSLRTRINTLSKKLHVFNKCCWDCENVCKLFFVYAVSVAYGQMFVMVAILSIFFEIFLV